MTNHIADALRNLFTTIGYPGVVVAMAIESCCIPLPSELIMPLAGFLIYQNRLTFVGTGHGGALAAAAVSGAIGCVVGSAAAYWIGATEGRPLLLRYGRYILISPRDAFRADAFFARHGEATAFFSRLLPIVRTFISLPAGIARMNFQKFLLYTFLGSLPWCAVLAYAGYKLGEHWKDVGSTLHKYDAVVIAVFVILVALYVYRHVRGSRDEDITYPESSRPADDRTGA